MDNPYEAPSAATEPPTAAKQAGQAKTSLILGLVSIVTWFIPLIGLPTTIAGIVYGVKGLGPQKRGMAIAGIVLSIIFLVLTILNAILGAYLAATGNHWIINAE